MYSFLWTGKDKQGIERGERVEAENAQAAKEILVQQGWTGLTLVKGEIGDVVKQYVAKPDRDDALSKMSPDEEVRWRRGERPSFMRKWFQSMANAKEPLILFGLIFAAGFYKHSPVSVFVGFMGIIGTVLLYPAIHTHYHKGSRLYKRLNQAKVWGRWDEVLYCVEELRKFRQDTKLGVTEAELVRNRAQALAATGHLEQALVEYEPFTKTPTVPHWIHLSHLAGIYERSRQFEKALELRREMTVEKPDTSVTWIDLAYASARYSNNPTEARKALARGEKLVLSDTAKPYIPFVRGMILWREGKPAEARPLLEEANAGYLARIKKPLVEINYMLTKSYLCAVHGALGNTQEAKKLFRECEKFLIAKREDELLAWCRKGLEKSAT